MNKIKIIVKAKVFQSPNALEEFLQSNYDEHDVIDYTVNITDTCILCTIRYIQEDEQ